MKPLPLLLLFAAAACASPSDVADRIVRVANYQIAHPSRERSTGWVQSAFYSGLCAVDRSGIAGTRYRAYLTAIGTRNRWKLGARVYHADDLAVGQSYLYLSAVSGDPRMFASVKERCDQILAHPPSAQLAFAGPDKNNRWAWCDALFMAPPVWIGLARATGNPAYRTYAIAHWWQSSAYLYDPRERLFYRDSTFFDKREPNGARVFWSRGNGWVLAGLARVLDELPPGDPSRPQFERQFRDIAGRVLQLQLPSGGWATSLLDPADCVPRLEESGTGFFCYGFAWGVNRGLLPRGVFAPAALRAWAALQGCLEPSGRLNHVQPIGSAPTKFPANATEAYGVGAYLFAGAEIYGLGG